MIFVFVMSPPHRLSKDQSMRFTRHLFGCPESQYGIEYEPTAQDLVDDPPDDCTCITGAPGSPIIAADAGDTPAPQPPLLPGDGSYGQRGGHDDSARAHDEEPFPPTDLAPPTGWRASVLSYTGTFEFMVDMKKRAKDPAWNPTEKQLAAINRSLNREGKPPQQEESVAEGLDIMPLADYRYAVEQQDGTYYAFVLSTGEGKWPGWRFVMGKQLPEGEIERLGRQKPAERYSGSRKRELVTVLAEPDVALDQYYEQTGICPVCFTRHDAPRCQG